MVKIQDKQFIIDGKPRLILAGEIHYFRLDKDQWQDRITKLKDAGFNAVATYIPWICHEEEEGQFDFDGHTRAELDLIGFIEMCEANNLYFIARPGPFIMAEMKNEGIPHWVIEKHPEIVPVSWNGKKVESTTLDYLAPAFLACTKEWYAQVMPILKEHLHDNGGKIIGVQLDNEIGMISWCSNSPDLTDVVLSDFRNYLKELYSYQQLEERYQFAVNDDDAFAEGVRNPQEEYVLKLHKDLGYYMRKRIVTYVERLTGYAKEYGVSGVPYLINIHGTGEGRGYTYPIGISQLYESYRLSDEYLSGSDIYLGDLDMTKFQDLYLINAYMEAVNRDNQPLASFEFECGDANYGETFGGRVDVSAVDFKTRMCIVQGNKLLNCYLFCGGRNYLMKNDLKDGNNRVAFTGERHGFAAPVNPEGKLGYTYERMAASMKTMAANEDKLAVMQEERDNLALGFIPDYYMTEYCYPQSEKNQELRAELTRFRGYDSFERLAKSMLLNNYRFTAVNIQDKETDQWQADTIVIFSASYMAAALQQKLVDYVKSGKSLMLYGLLPSRDMEGDSCTILKDALGVGNTHLVYGKAHYYLSTTPKGYLSGSAEVGASYAQCYEVEDALVLMETADTKEICGFEKALGDGKVLVMSSPYIAHLANIRKMMESLGCAPMLEHQEEYHGLFMSISKHQEERFLHILNLDGFGKKTKICYRGEYLFDGKEMEIAPKDGLMLPLNMNVEGGKILYATAEITARTTEQITFRQVQKEETIVFEGTGVIAESPAYTIAETDQKTYLRSLNQGAETLTVKYLK